MPQQLIGRSLAREVNAQISRIDALFGADGSEYRLLCECGRQDCFDRIDVPRSVYRDVRDHADRFLVVSGHESDHDEVVNGTGDYRVIAPQRPELRAPLRVADASA